MQVNVSSGGKVQISTLKIELSSDIKFHISNTCTYEILSSLQKNIHKFEISIVLNLIVAQGHIKEHSM